MSNRYDSEANYLPAQVTRGPAVRIDGAHVQRIAETALQAPTNAEMDGAALAALETVSEKSTPISRAGGVAIKSGAIVAIAGIVALPTQLLGASGGLTWWIFAIFAVVGVLAVNWLDYRHSPIGGERHKATLFAGIRHHEIDSNERVALAKLAAYQQTLERVYGGANRDQD